MYCRFQPEFSTQIIILNFMSQLKIYTNKGQNLEHKCVLQESCKTMRRWQRSILLVKGGHCVGDWGRPCCLRLRRPLVSFISCRFRLTWSRSRQSSWR